MGNEITKFNYGEDIQFSMGLTNRAVYPAKIGTPLVDAANQTISFIISDVLTGTSLLEVTTASGIALVGDPANAIWNVDIARAAASVLAPEQEYHYDVWSTALAGSPRIHQRSDTFMLGPSTEPA